MESSVSKYYWSTLSTSSQKYHMLAKHRADADSTPPPDQRQTTLDSSPWRRMDNSTSNKFPEAIAKWVTTVGRPIKIVEDEA